MHTATATWYDSRDCVFVDFCVKDSKGVQVQFEKTKLNFSCINGKDNVKLENTVELFGDIDPIESKHSRTDMCIKCCLQKVEAGKKWPRLIKDKKKCNWLKVDFSKWEDWEDDSCDEQSYYDKFSEMMNSVGGNDLPDLDDEHDSDDDNLPDLESVPPQ